MCWVRSELKIESFIPIDIVINVSWRVIVVKQTEYSIVMGPFDGQLWTHGSWRITCLSATFGLELVDLGFDVVWQSGEQAEKQSLFGLSNYLLSRFIDSRIEPMTFDRNSFHILSMNCRLGKVSNGILLLARTLFENRYPSGAPCHDRFDCFEIFNENLGYNLTHSETNFSLISR